MEERTFGQWVKGHRTALGWTGGHLGERIGKSKGWVSQIENDRNPQTKQPIKLSYSNIEAIVNAFREGGRKVAMSEAVNLAGVSVPSARQEGAEGLAEELMRISERL